MSWLNTSRSILLLGIALVINILLTLYGDKDGVGSHLKVSLPQGKLRGMEMTTRKKRVIIGFQGIPYAQPPIGDLRFRAPLPPLPWNGTLNATQLPNRCLQIDDDIFRGDEDCLFINVYTPQLPSTDSELLPVMFWIHGGSFYRGTGDASEVNPDYLLDKDVILVGANYRLGAFGFLCTGDEVSPGNYGMKDQAMALQWVQNNIKYFGGDPNRVTIFGMSAGSTAVDYHALSDLSKGLYHQSIKLSGSALGYLGYIPREALVPYSFRLGKHLDCSNSTSSTLVKCLREIDAVKITDTFTLFFEWQEFPQPVWGVTDEPDIEGAFLTDSPKNLYAAGKFKDHPAISGVVRDEGLIMTANMYEKPEKFDDFLENIDQVLPYLGLYYHRQDASALTDVLKSYYLNDLTVDKLVLLANLTDFISDCLFIYPTYAAHKQQFKLGQSPKYFYSFEYLRTFRYKNDSKLPPGVQHADDEPYIFVINPDWCAAGWSCDLSEAEFEMVDIIIDFWTSFAINGTPFTSYNNAVTWSAYSTEDNYLRIGNGAELSLEMKHSLLPKRMEFWDHIHNPRPAE